METSRVLVAKVGASQVTVLLGAVNYLIES